LDISSEAGKNFVKRYSLAVTPSFAIFDKSGQLRKSYSGEFVSKEQLLGEMRAFG